MTPDGETPKFPPLREVIAQHNLRARKALGQNFLLDLNLTRRIARAAEVHDAPHVLEIGPGPGGLTRALLAEGAQSIIAVETDPRAVGALAPLEQAYPGRLRILEADALSIDAAALFPQGAPVIVVANLPYNIATALLVKWLHAPVWPPWFKSLTLMFQKEVADRIVAVPRTKAYGRLSILAQWRCDVNCLFDIPPDAFVPRPKVTSTVVGFTPRPEPRAPAEQADLERVTAAAFGQRRKMLRGSLKTLPFPPGSSAEAILNGAGIEPTKRAEDLTVEQFCDLARAYRSATNT